MYSWGKYRINEHSEFLSADSEFLSVYFSALCIVGMQVLWLVILVRHMSTLSTHCRRKPTFASYASSPLKRLNL